jgi:hypothetical protein
LLVLAQSKSKWPEGHLPGAKQPAEKLIKTSDRPENHPAGVKQAAEKLRDLSGGEENHPSAAQAGTFLLDLSARMNPCAFKTALHLSFSASCQAVPFYKTVL